MRKLVSKEISDLAKQVVDLDKPGLTADMRRCLEPLDRINVQLTEQRKAQHDEVIWGRIFDQIDLMSMILFLILNCSVTFSTFFRLASELS